jgi:hypothetical protein
LATNSTRNASCSAVFGHCRPRVFVAACLRLRSARLAGSPGNSARYVSTSSSPFSAHHCLRRTDDSEFITGSEFILKFKCIKDNRVAEKAHLEMELAFLSGAVNHPNRLEPYIFEVGQAILLRDLSIETLAAK